MIWIQISVVLDCINVIFLILIIFLIWIIYHNLAEQRSEKYEYEIRKDVGRTFEIMDPSFTEKLERTLTAYANRNPTLGYPFLFYLLVYLFA